MAKARKFNAALAHFFVGNRYFRHLAHSAFQFRRADPICLGGIEGGGWLFACDSVFDRPSGNLPSPERLSKEGNIT